MPLYEYHCAACGNFTVLRKISESNMPASCETCGGTSKRVISAPHLALLGQAQRIAHQRNEKSAHEPGSLRRSSCGCTGGHTCKTNSNTEPAKTQESAFQMQAKKTARPWMLGH